MEIHHVDIEELTGGQADASLIVFGDSVEEITNMFRTYVMHMK